ncbi:MAG: hypothetical protein IJR88_02885, partial [Clostridia bacterium]|nr:hypothetical protein [Clostridia bacterium]
IDAARAAYNALTADQKALITEAEYKVLTDAEAAYAKLKADHEAADAVKTKINAIGTVVYTTESKAKIDAAREAYDKLTADQKALITEAEYKILTDAEVAYAKLKADHDAADAVKTKINAIGTVVYTTESKGKIDEARAAYNALTNDQKALISEAEYKVLTDAEASYAKLKADHDAADAVKGKINAIGVVVYTAESKAKIDAAREAYDKLTDDQKALITEAEYKVLTDAEAAYAQKKAAAEAAYAKQKADRDAANAAKEIINAIGTVEYTEACKAKIDAARAAYNALTADQKALITEAEYKVLTDAEAAYAKLKADHEAADAVKALINAIGTVEYTETCRGKIGAARTAYNALTASQKTLVDETTLLAAEAEYKRLEQEGKEKLEEGNVTVTIPDGSVLIPLDIELKVELKTEVKSESASEDYSEKVEKLLADNEEIFAVYDVKLVRIINGVEKEIQPSDIKEGTVILVTMEIPSALKGKDFKVMHIHSADDIEYVEYTVENGEIRIQVDRLSQFAFVSEKAETTSKGSTTGIIIASVAVVLLVIFFLLFFLLKKRNKEEDKKKKNDTK